MPRELALLICTAFVIALLWFERRDSAGVSAALWIPTIWMLAIASKPLGVWFGISGDAESISLIDRIGLTGLGILGILVLVRRHHDSLQALKGHGWLLALLAYMLISTLWSDVAFIAMRRWAREVNVLIMALA